MIKKPYTKPEVHKVEMDSDVIRMLTKKGFADLFWEKLQEARKENNCITQEAVFNVLNAKYTNVIGCTRYSDFDSFRKVRDKK
jgi:glutamate racemase